MHDMIAPEDRPVAAPNSAVSEDPTMSGAPEARPVDRSEDRSKARHFIINGRFLATEPVGVHRVATELVRHAHALIEATPDLARRIALDLWIPADAEERAKALGVPYRVIGPLKGNAWEQATLPLRAGGRTVVSLCNVGPIARTNAVTMLHDVQVVLSPASYSPNFRRWYLIQQPACGRRHRRILTVSGFSREQIAKAGVAPEEKVTVIHNGCDHVLADRADDTIIDRLGIAKGSYVLGLSSMQAHKNIAVLLRAFSRPALKDKTLVLFGSTPREAFAKAGLPVGDNVVFAGRVSDGELRALYENAQVFAFPSTTEGFGLPPLEAMRLGTPAIVAPCGALPEACGDGALYVGPDDDEGWADTIATFSQKPHRAAMSARALAHARTMGWDAAARSLVETLLAT
ncbi:group 1 glycosyl transferase [Croceicoccus mobilis]|uniref:Group 1 glycosyl transferase n=2 Tax=Croceicoccus mobilis TaxID=1703339 RepID=A0A916Z1X7_9SPHN|nr:group 1 glycosyl transferase [Croceicoccus mobilis]